MTRIKKYDEETVVYGKRVPKSKLADVTDLVEKYLMKFETNKTQEDGAEKKTRAHRVVLPLQHDGDNMLMYPCGCHWNNFAMFMRHPNCNIAYKLHKSNIAYKAE